MENKRIIKVFSVIFVYFLAVFLTVLVVRIPTYQVDTEITEETTLESKESTETTKESETNDAENSSEATLEAETESTDEEETTSETENSTSETVSTEEKTTASDTANRPTDEGETKTTEESSDMSQSEEFVRLMGKAGCDINSVNCNQLVIVESSGNSAVVYMYEKNSSGIWEDAGLTVSGWVGSNGVDEKSQEGDGKTPYGLYPIGEAFYIEDQPATGLPSFQITENTYWVDDPNSAYYNMKVEGTDNMDWNSAEHMISYSVSYKYGFVVNFNMNPIVPGKGSAIFFHCGSGPTAGCVAVPENYVLSYLAKLDANKNPYILMM